MSESTNQVSTGAATSPRPHSLPQHPHTPVTLSVRDLVVHYHTSRGAVQAVNGVSFDVRQGERLGLVGESGSGKTTIALALLRLIRPPGRIEGGEMLLDDLDLLSLTEEEMRRVRLAKIALVAQGAMNSLNPVLRVQEQIRDGLKDHALQLSSRAFDDRVVELLHSVGLRRDVANMYPHELSGGMKQRVCIAIAISLRPKLIIADEPTSALDVVVQRQVMDTLLAVQEDLGASVILIGHDMGLMAQVVDRVGIMYAGNLAEISPVGELFQAPLHPYSDLLIASLPSLEEKGAFQGIPGLPPSLLTRPTGCSFRARCPRAFERCATVEPRLREVEAERFVSCHLY
ncbi:MAG: ABC transporter ATP-binding protein [Thermomicrobiales bacterium]